MDPKTVELISIAVASALRCEHCLKTHVRVAKRLGVSKEEIFDSVLIASSVSTAAVLAEGTRSVDNAFADEETSMASSANCSICNINSELPEED
jgi:AhpD family alkylhydroperoxidase